MLEVRAFSDVFRAARHQAQELKEHRARLEADPVPCLRCGACCRSGPCLIAILRWGPQNLRGWQGSPACPDLGFDGHRYRCRVHGLRELAGRLGLVLPGDSCLMPNLRHDPRLPRIFPEPIFPEPIAEPSA